MNSIMRSLIRSLFVIFLVTITACVQEPAVISVTNVTLDSSSMELTEGESYTLHATVSPSNADNQTVLWTSSNSSVATVNRGVIQALSPGQAIITATSDDGGKTATCTVTVKAKVIAVNGITLNQTSLNLKAGNPVSLEATVSPENATNKNVLWSSSNESVASVNSTGLVNPLSTGTTIISAVTEDGGFKAQCEVNVTVAVTGIALSQTTASIIEGESITLIASVVPANATNQEVIWESSKPDIATVNNGHVTGIKVGTSEITATTKEDAKKATCIVTVFPVAVSGVSLNKTSLTLRIGETETLVATVMPENATDKTVTWSVANSSIATVSSQGEVTALSVGSTTVTATSSDGTKKATCSVSVQPIDVLGISLNKTSLTLHIGETETLVATVMPENATDKMVTWSVANSSIATVSSQGEVTALSVGSTTVTATSSDGTKKATCSVYVQPIDVSGISLNKTSLTLHIGETETLVATVMPENATDKTVTWSVANSSIATVSSRGEVTALSVGSTTVTATSSDGTKKATCSVYVQPIDVSGISLNKTSLTLHIGETETLVATVMPENATDKTVTWSVANSSIAMVSSQGEVTALSVGSTTVTATSSDGTKKATCSVSVQPITVTEISLDKQYLSMYANDTKQLVATILPSNATDQSVTWSSSNSQIASVSSTGYVTAIAAGSAVISATSNDGGLSASCSVSVWPSPSEAVDMGTSVKWAVRNVGADIPEDFGDYFAWGETASKTYYHYINNYKWINGSQNNYTKYNILPSWGVVDNKITLEPEDDAAYVNWGEKWRTPTKEEFQELIDKCTWTWTTLDNQNGYKVSSKQTGNSIFLPAAGYRNNSNINYDGSSGYYNSSSLKTDNSQYAYNLYFRSDVIENRYGIRGFGYSVRPVMDKEDRIPVSGVTVTPSELSLVEGSSGLVSASVIPSNATNQDIVWKSSNTSVATVSGGTILAKSPGSVTIMAISVDGNHSATCSVTVSEDNTKVKSLSFESSALFVGSGNSYSLNVLVQPEEAVGNFTWKSSNSSAVSVTGRGKIATVASNYTSTGYATVTVTDQRTGLSASIKVYSFIESFSWNESTEETYGGEPLITIPVGGTHQLKYTSSAGSNVLNLFGDKSNFVFYEPSTVVTSPTNITLSAEGLVTGVKTGTTGIKPTGSIPGGGKRVYFKVANSLYESEYNDSKDYANTVSYGMPMSFSLLNTSDVDWFKLLMDSSASGYVSVTISVEYSGSSSLAGSEARLCKYSLYDSAMQQWGAGSFSFSNTSSTASTTRNVPAGPLFLKIYFDTSYDSRLCPSYSMILRMTVN